VSSFCLASEYFSISSLIFFIMAESLDLRQTASGKEEEDCILDNLKHIDKFMAAVKTRTGSISTKTRDELLRLKANFDIAVMALEEQQNEEDRASKGAIPNKRYKKTSESSRNTDTDSTSGMPIVTR
jgi:hypothetical protein